ncbi:Tetratricopeptide repeat protein [Aphelenchoides fujianensis]|nr:Tetratricopeptide repeat protein [Aphelenchoides fujianensis]
MAAEGPKSEDPYGGFNEYDHAYDLGNAYDDADFLRAVQRTSHSRRPTTANRAPAVDPRRPTAQGGA